ncbi:YfhO family protein [Ohtaekwangia kribbensis]|jgi:hypothetical protein|uniref:YfhO family protein n=1 Tax=Ohtaekwangia kribbensis TaxID=688913 RepID=A0ABW3K0Z0_9BACT
MKKIKFTEQVLPHLVAVGVFLVITVFFFNPVFFDNKTISQYDIQQWEGSSKALRDYRDKTGEEGLWADAMFSGMPAYLVNTHWSNGPVSFLKRALSLSLPHPIANIFLAFISYYILLLAFRVRPYLAIAGAVAFGLSSYMIIGFGAGHNARIGAIAFMPLVMAGIHLAFSRKWILGFGVTTAGLALHLKENHLQITYYLLFIVLVYGLIQLIDFLRENRAADFFKTIAILVVAAVIAAGSFIGPMWAVTEYSQYSIRGETQLVSAERKEGQSGLDKSYAFRYSYGIWEPMTLLVPNFYGGLSSNYLVQDPNSEVYKALSRSGDEQMANQLAQYTSAYWGINPLNAPYYGGAIIFFLFVLGIVFADGKYVGWLIPVIIFGIMASWGDSAKWFNYALFDYLPGYNKFRSVTFLMILPLFAFPLLGMLGLEKLFTTGVDKAARKKLLIVLGATGGLCVLLFLFGGMMSFMSAHESQLPAWFTSALADDRKSLFRSDVFRSLAFIVAAFVVIYFEVWKKISPIAFYAFLIIMITLDLAIVDKRYFGKDKYQRKRENTMFAMNAADQEILKDKSHYRVYNLQGTFEEARTSYFHNSIGGYHGVKMRRYQDLYDTCLFRETNEFIQDVQSGKADFSKYGVMNMLNVKYIVFGPERNNIIPNPAANGNGWFVSEVITVSSPTEEVLKTCGVNTRTTAVIDGSRFKVESVQADTTATLTLADRNPNYQKYESQSQASGLAVFSEIYYPKGWKAFVDGKETEIICADYVLRAVQVPAGKHVVEFKFEPAAYYTGNKITMISSWLMLVALLGSVVWSVRKEDA